MMVRALAQWTRWGRAPARGNGLRSLAPAHVPPMGPSPKNAKQGCGRCVSPVWHESTCALWDSGGLCRQTGPFCDAGVVYAPAARLKGSVEPGLQEPRFPSHTSSGIGSESPTCLVSRRTPMLHFVSPGHKGVRHPTFPLPDGPGGASGPLRSPPFLRAGSPPGERNGCISRPITP
jgi:hypothetical protein